MTKTGPNNTSSVVWALGMSFLFLRVFHVLTNDIKVGLGTLTVLPPWQRTQHDHTTTTGGREGTRNLPKRRHTTSLGLQYVFFCFVFVTVILTLFFSYYYYHEDTPNSTTWRQRADKMVRGNMPKRPLLGYSVFFSTFHFVILTPSFRYSYSTTTMTMHPTRPHDVCFVFFFLNTNILF